MMNDLKSAVIRQHGALLADFAGVAALAVVFVVALHLPGMM
ncbi:hypothetical protein [Ovoidimarina sediminis]|nr:hypothetical protein [Rhodophyticola sp. MJ-SS7]MDU8941893.1 hypothetical protein [Rhodophyticola sp. MJ-SS7]